MKVDAETLCRLFSSDKVGERASAAAMADRLLKAIGADWADVLAPRALAHPAKGGVDDIDFALQRQHLLYAWQRRFVGSLRRWRGPLTEKQRTKLNEIVSELRRAA